MFETIIAYLIIIAPSFVTLVGALVTVVCSINKLRKNSAETQAAVAEAKKTVEEIQSSPQLKEMLATIVSENVTLKKSLTLAYEEITRIHKLHPEWLEGGEGNEE